MKRIPAVLRNYIVDAVALIVLGLVLLIWPDYTLETIFKWIGVGLIVLGAIKVVLFFVKRNRSVIGLLVGLVQLAFGIFIFAKPGFLVAFFPTVAAILLGYGAIVMIARALKLREVNRNAFLLPLVLGIICLILAVIIFVHPVLLADLMVQASGMSMIVEGISLLLALSRAV